jgi:NADH-quinone oxidoreductase subunit H
MDQLLDPVFLITVAKIAIPLILFNLLVVLVVMERRGAAYIQDRPGPNRAAINLGFGGIASIFALNAPANSLRLRAFGAIFNIADAVKLLFKERFVPHFVEHKWVYAMAPAIPMITGLLTPALIPWFGPIAVAHGGVISSVSGQIIDANSGILMLFALGSLSVYGVVLGSWASNSKFSLLGGMRASAMMISYEVSMGLAVMSMLLIVGSLSLTQVVDWQGAHVWGIFVQPLGFLLFLVAMFAECNRTPFDVAEGDSEIVAGYLTEYSSVRFMTFMASEYLHMLVASALIATVYLGGYHLLPCPLPLNGLGEAWVALDTNWVRGNLGPVLAVLLVISALGAFFVVWLLNRRRVRMLTRPASDKALRVREYGFYMLVFGGLGLGMIAAGAAACAFIRSPVPVEGVYPLWVSLLTAVVQFHVVVIKTILICWLFVWVRWTLPRFRYDQIMGLGWKVMLNLAWRNLVATAVISKLVR